MYEIKVIFVLFCFMYILLSGIKHHSTINFLHNLSVFSLSGTYKISFYYLIILYIITKSFFFLNYKNKKQINEKILFFLIKIIQININAGSFRLKLRLFQKGVKWESVVDLKFCMNTLKKTITDCCTSTCFYYYY